MKDGARLSLREMLAAPQRVRIRCTDCGRDRTVALSMIVHERDVRADAVIRQIERRIRCTRCGGKRVEILVPSHVPGPQMDERERRLETNVKRISCPGCGTLDVSRSPPLVRPLHEQPNFLSGLVYEYECEACGNWWTAD